MATNRSKATIAGDGPGEGYVHPRLVVLLLIGASIVAVLVLYSLGALWPTTTGKSTVTQRVTWLGWHARLSRESLFFFVVACAGALGGSIHTIRSFAWYVGNRDLRKSWLAFYLLLPLVGALGGTVFYLVLRAGLFSPSTSVDQASPFGFAAVAALVGLFSEQALEKLRQVASNLFSERQQGADHVEPAEDQAKPEGEDKPDPAAESSG